MSDLSVTLVQTELAWENAEANLQLLGDKLSQIEPTDLIILPEMFTTGFSMSPEKLAENMEGLSVQWMKGKSAELNSVICGSLIISESGQFFNRFIAIHPDGAVDVYDKKHLFTLAGEDNNYSSGTDKILITIKGWKLCPLICYDLRFPVWARSQKQAESAWEYDGLIYVANWPRPRISAWDTLLRARAIENQAFCIGVNRIGTDDNGLEYVGHSAAYDFAGESLIAPFESEDIKSVILSKSSLDEFRRKLPFQQDSDSFKFI